MQKGRIKYNDTRASEKELLEYNEKEYAGKGGKLHWEQCNCKSNFTPGIVCDPFMGSGTVALVSEMLGYKWIGMDLAKKYNILNEKRTMVEADQGKLKL